MLPYVAVPKAAHTWKFVGRHLGQPVGIGALVWSVACGNDPSAANATGKDSGAEDSGGELADQGGTDSDALTPPPDGGGPADAIGSDADGAKPGPDGDATLPDGPPTVPAIPTFAGFWGGYGTAPGEFIEPSSVELDSAGFVYVAGHEDRFQKFTRDGQLVAVYGSPGTGDGQFNHPHGLAVDRARGDLIYIGDQNNNRVQVFTTDGAFVRLWGDPQFQHIHDVGIDQATGELFIGDYELDTVRKFDPTGIELAQYGGTGPGPGQFDGVWGISTSSSGAVYVADTFNRRIQKLDQNGVYLDEWNDFAGDAFLKPTGVFVDANNLVYLCDSLADEVMVFDESGAPLQRWDLGAIVGFQSEPEDIVIDAAGENIYIGEVRNHRVLHLVRP